MSEPNDPFLAELERGDLEALTKALAELSDTNAPSPTKRASLMAALAETNRFEELVGPVAEATDLSDDAASALLLAIDDPARWTEGPFPAVELLHFEGGPAVARAITGFVRVAPGGCFPEHDHLGSERVIILQGAVRDTATGETHRRGAILDAGPGVEHQLEVVSSIPLVYLAVAQEGIRIGDMVVPYDDPRA